MKRNKEIKIDIRVSSESAKSIVDFLSRYRNESVSSLVQKSMKRFIRYSRSENKELNNLVSPGDLVNVITPGKHKLHAKVNEMVFDDFCAEYAKRGYISLSAALRVSIWLYIYTEPFTPSKPLILDRSVKNVVILD